MKKLMSLVLTAALAAALFSGCGGTGSTAEPSSAVPAASEAVASEAVPSSVVEAPAPEQTTASLPEAEVSVPEDIQEDIFPVQDDVTVSMFTSVNSAVAPYVDAEHYDQISVLRGWSEHTGVKLDVTAVTSELAKEQFALLAASNSVPDIIVQGGAWYPGGASAGVKDEVFLNMADYKEYMPNYLAAIEKYGFTSNVMTDDEISAFWQINVNNLPFAGIVARGDLLDEIGMNYQDIKTFDDWDQMLRGMKGKDGVIAPLALSVIGDMGTSNVLSGGYGISAVFQNGSYVNLPLYVVDGKVQFGFLTEQYDKYVKTISTWYKDGLINDHILSMEGGPYCEEYVLRGENAVFTTMLANASYYAEQLGGDAYYVALHMPMENEGDTYHFSDSEPVTLESGVWNVSFNCEDPELVIQMIDWFYTDEGSRLISYGIEGESYELDSDGNIVLTDLITNNPDLSASSAMILYAGDLIPGMKDASRLLSTYEPDVIEALEYVQTQDADGAYNMPSGLSSSFTEEEQEIYATYSPDLLTYMSEHALAFLMGEEDIANLPAFKQTIQDMHIQDIIDVYQDAYDRMMAQ